MREETTDREDGGGVDTGRRDRQQLDQQAHSHRPVYSAATTSGDGDDYHHRSTSHLGGD